MKVGGFLLLCVFFLCCPTKLFSRTIIITPEKGIVFLNQALKETLPGDTILLKKGVYNGKIYINQIKGKPEFPIVIRGEGINESIINGNSLPGLELEKYGCQIKDSKWIVLENLQFYDCWTDIIKIKYSNYISVKNCKAIGGKRFLFAEGFSSHHLLIENCHWEQDEKVWTHANGYTWDELHHGEYSYYNGSLYQGSSTGGVFVLRNNTIQNTFNAFRLSRISGGQIDYLSCSNGEIYGNLITNTSDNVLEPEVYCSNLHFYHNRMINGHAFISITEVGGGPIYLYGNTGLSQENCVDGWTIFKVSSNERSLDQPFYIFNNSWHVDYNIFGSNNHVWKNNHIHHFNNAYNIKEGTQFGIYNIGEYNSFDYDCSNLDFPLIIKNSNNEQHGLIANPQFRDSKNGDFKLQSSSPCINSGTIPTEFELTYGDEFPDIGCYQGEKLIEGPPFRFMPPAKNIVYTEKPRIVRHRCENNKLTIWFSAPIVHNSNLDTMVQVIQDNKRLKLSGITLHPEGYKLTIQSSEKIDPQKISLAFSRWPMGKNQELATSWASTIKIVKPIKQINTGSYGSELKKKKK